MLVDGLKSTLILLGSRNVALIQLTQKSDKKRLGINPAQVTMILDDGEGCTVCTTGARQNGAGLNVKVFESYEEVFARISMRNAMTPSKEEA